MTFSNHSQRRPIDPNAPEQAGAEFRPIPPIMRGRLAALNEAVMRVAALRQMIEKQIAAQDTPNVVPIVPGATVVTAEGDHTLHETTPAEDRVAAARQATGDAFNQGEAA